MVISDKMVVYWLVREVIRYLTLLNILLFSKFFVKKATHSISQFSSFSINLRLNKQTVYNSL